jgi:hypothetical protein
MPQIVHLPPVFTEHDPGYELDPLLGRLLTGDNPRSAVVEVGGSLDLRFASSAVTTATRITGDTDWAVYVVITIRQVLAAALMAKPGDNKLLTKLDDTLKVADVWDCAIGAAQEIAAAQTAAEKIADIGKATADCFKEVAVGAVAKGVGDLLGVAKDTVENFLKGRADPLLALPDLMDLARGEVTGILQAAGKAGGGLDTSVTIVPVRVMNFAEASALPLTPLAGAGQCQPPPANVPLPAGAPADTQCVFVVSADLDGNGKPDRLLLWQTQALNDPAQPPDGQYGAVAYLDDGTFHILEESPATWRLPNFFSVEQLYPAQVAYLGNDRRQQVMVSIILGANTNWRVIMTVGADRRLHALSAADGFTVTLSSGGGAAYSSGYGCVVSQGQPLIASGTSRTISSVSLATGYKWTTDYYELHDLQWAHIATAAGQAPLNGWTGVNVGSNCSNPDPSQRGPKIGTP